jgi:glycosyltransferase involved in cell wall biosynthesis
MSLTTTTTINKLGILIVCFNRAKYTRQCFQSIEKAKLPEGATIMLIDDCSTEKEAVELFQNFHINGVAVIKLRNDSNKGIKANLKTGFEKLFADGCSIVLNLDNDAVVKPDAFIKLQVTKLEFPAYILTGFNCNMLNPDGTERHPISEMKVDCYRKGTVFKKSVGGINFCLEMNNYSKYVQPALDHPGNWDHNACIAATKDGHPIVCLVPSVIQHIGLESSMGHMGTAPDVADDFDDKKKLADVTLFGIDCVQYNKLIQAAEQSQKELRFANTILLNSPTISSKEQYSAFMMKDLDKFINTSHVLVIQHDGYVLNAKAWNDDWLQFDYVGATWGYKDGFNVGNGGFSLRSKKLIKILAEDPHISILHPEDDQICRGYRPYLEEKYKIKFAPEEVANRFSIEAYGSHDTRYSGQFGFHGFNINYENSNLPHIPQKPIQPNQIRRRNRW